MADQTFRSTDKSGAPYNPGSSPLGNPGSTPHGFEKAASAAKGVADQAKDDDGSDAEPAAFRLLQQHDADHGRNDHEVYHDNNGLHEPTKLMPRLESSPGPPPPGVI